MTPLENSEPPRQDLVMIGGGHAHVGVLRSFMMRPEPGLRLTLIAKELEAPYSGMLPGFVAGAYARQDAHIDLLPLSMAAGARLIIGAAAGLDLEDRRVLIPGRESVRFDLLSLNIGVTPRLGGVEGADQHAIPVKPVSEFADRWEALRLAASQPEGPRRIAVIGGGAAGFELVLAAAKRLRDEANTSGDDPARFVFTLISGASLLKGFAPGARRAAYAALNDARIGLVENDPAVAMSATEIRLASGAVTQFDAAMIAAEAEAPSWLRDTGLALDEQGYASVAATLESTSHPGVFAAGDCASIIGQPRPKAGVFAVRQGPPLTRNLRRAARGEAPLPFRPQQKFLSLLSTADGSAIASRGGWSAKGAWVWRWKDWIDRSFMDKHRPPPMPETQDMRCGGCAAKIGPATLRAALARLGDRPETEDAAVIDEGGDEVRVESVDYFRSFWSDPYLFGRIAAKHALGDIYAMGARPKTAQAIATVPLSAPKLREEDLFQLIAGARSYLDGEGVALLGGHSSEGAEMALGFSVSGHVSRRRILRKGGLRAGDRLILTHPIGAGVLFAASMRGLASGPAIASALEAMQRPQAGLVEILRAHGATAATDVTGFGLAGHLLEMLSAAGLGADIDLGALPLFPQARDLAESGVASSLLPENLALAAEVSAPDDASFSAADLALLFDPQTAGPFLVGLPSETAEKCLFDLQQAGSVSAAIIGVARPQDSRKARLCAQGRTR